MALHVLRPAALAGRGDARTQLGDELPHALVVGLKRGAVLVDERLENLHAIRLFGHFDFGREQVLRVRLPLRVEQQRQRAAAAEAAMKQKIHREQIRQLEALDLALAHVVEMALHERRRQVLEHPRVDRLRARDDADVGGVALVAGAREAQAQSGTRRTRKGSGCGVRHHAYAAPCPFACPFAASATRSPRLRSITRCVTALARHQRRPERHDLRRARAALIGDVGDAGHRARARAARSAARSAS